MKKEIEQIINELVTKNIIDVSTIPNIDLYVDQLTSFIEDNLYSNNENHLTKSMVNNYCKNKVIPPSIKKKYDKNHIILLIIIYNTKSIISISDIQKIFETFKDIEIIDYYNIIANLITILNQNLSEQVNSDLDYINEINFDNDKSKYAILATKLAYEANCKKMLAEMLIEKYL